MSINRPFETLLKWKWNLAKLNEMLRLNEYFKNREVRRNRYLTFNYEAIVYQDKYYVVSRAIYPNFFSCYRLFHWNVPYVLMCVIH